MAESKYIEKKPHLAHYRHEPAKTPAAAEPDSGAETVADAPQVQKEEFHKFILFLRRKCGLEFRGRVLEIGAGSAWFSAELSKLPRVVEVVTTDCSPKPLRDQAPKMFKLLKANEAKITRMTADFYRLDFQNDHFDFVVCSALLHHGVNVLQLLRESRRVLKPGGQFVAIREPVKKSATPEHRGRSRKHSQKPGVSAPGYALAEFKHFFERAGLEITVQRMNLSLGFRHYLKQVVKGLAPTQYALIGIKRGRIR